jgi:CheY-like chemotaxis protein
VVRSKVEALGGSLRVWTEPDRGTRFQLNVPFAVTRERLLIVAVGGLRVAFPSRIVREIVKVSERVESRAKGALRFEDTLLPLRSMSALLGVAPESEDHALVLELADQSWALTVPGIVGEHDLIRTPADPLLAKISLFGSTACLDDGALILVPQLDRLLALLRSSTLPEPTRRAAARKPRALVVDDSPIVRDLVTDVLADAGLEVLVASDGAEGIRCFESAEPDIVLSDVEMPNMDGFEFLRHVRSRTQRIPVVMLTTRGSLEDRKRATALGASAYLTKSDFRAGALLDTVARFVDIQR